MTDRSKTVVMLIDWDNLQICHNRDAPGMDLDLNALTALAQSYGTVVSARAYAEWNILAERLAVYKAGIEPVFAPVMRPESGDQRGKSLADTVMVTDGVDLLWTVKPDVFILVTSDKDMLPLARIVKQRGAAVVILGSDLTAIPLVEISNVFITYRQLLRELDRTPELGAPSGRAPARERRVPSENRRSSVEPGSRGQAAATSSRSRASSAAPAAPAPLPETASAVGAPSAAPSVVMATVASSSGPTVTSSDGEELDALAGETPARRRRRRGRRRGTGVAADLAAVDSGEVEALSGDAAAIESETAPMTGTAPIQEPLDPISSAPEAPRPVRVRAPATRRSPLSAARPTFSEFGAPAPTTSPTPTADPAPAQSPEAEAGEPVGSAGIESAALANDVATETTEEVGARERSTRQRPATKAEPGSNADRSGDAPVPPTDPDRPADVVAPPSTNGATEDAASAAAEPAAETPRRPVRRRRTRATPAESPASSE